MALLPSDLFPVGRGAATHKTTWADVQAVVTVGASAPTGPKQGQLWLNTNNGITYTYNGSVWVGH